MPEKEAEGRKGWRARSCLGCLGKGVAIGVLVLAVLLGAWLVVNRPPATEPVRRDHLSDRQVLLTRESQHLRAAVGERIWPGFGKADIPVYLYNDRYGFLVGAPSAPQGWQRVEANAFDGQPYWRTDRPEKQSFAIHVDDLWAGGLAVKDQMDAEVPRLFQEKLGLLGRLIPYRLLILDADRYGAGIVHEQFHAYEAVTNSKRFQRSRDTYSAAGRYPWDAPSYRDAWMREVGLLKQAEAAQPDDEKARLAREFLAARRERRDRFLADAPDLLAFEQEVEWLEGLGKYAERQALMLPGQPGYEPLPGMAGDAQFDGYSGFDKWWRQERMNMSVRANLHGDLPFYETGMMQALLLDALRPGWKQGYLEGDAPLDDTLAEALRKD
jgi:hypothetical protein